MGHKSKEGAQSVHNLVFLGSIFQIFDNVNVIVFLQSDLLDFFLIYFFKLEIIAELKLERQPK